MRCSRPCARMSPAYRLPLTAFFSLDRPGPNLGFLSPASREKMTEAILARAQEGELEAGNLMETAGRVLSGAELADYTRWNAPVAAALRNRLAGFDADERSSRQSCAGRRPPDPSAKAPWRGRNWNSRSGTSVWWNGNSARSRR